MSLAGGGGEGGGNLAVGDDDDDDSCTVVPRVTKLTTSLFPLALILTGRD